MVKSMLMFVVAIVIYSFAQEVNYNSITNLEIVFIDDSDQVHVKNAIRDDNTIIKESAIIYINTNNSDTIPKLFPNVRELKIVSQDFDASFISAFSKLEKLGLHYCRFENLCKDSVGFKNLKVLEINHCIDFNFFELSSHYRIFTNLEFLYITNCKVEEIPASIGGFSNIKYLELAGNKLTQLPNEIVNLRRLEMIGLIRNRFTKFPPQLLKMNKSVLIVEIGHNAIEEEERIIIENLKSKKMGIHW